jgi:hypothetical protein
MKRLFTVLLFATTISVLTFAQNTKTIDATLKNATNPTSGILKMGNPGVDGKKLEVNSQYLTLNGKPIIPVMAEVHYSRIPRDQWEDVLLKMKACGVNIIASYVIWIHHEEIEGQFDWSGNKNLREFAKLCAKHDLWFYSRIGPWVHAEVRNGGTPDWILTKTNLKNRSNDPVYQSYVKQWYEQISIQLKGLMYKDGGPVIGTQLENEFRHGKNGEAHIMWLKETAQKCGFDVPLYTVTGWQNGSVPPYEVIPLWAAYPDAPWADNLKRNTDKSDFLFKKYRDTDAVGDNVEKKREQYIDYSAYPYFTCEVGVGIMNTDHRRLKIDSRDGLALIMAKIGSGSNLPGYYMFTGGSNPLGELTTLEENREEEGSYNTNPVISYDFQAAINESGRLNNPYFEVKKLHYFLNEFGDRLAPLTPVFQNNDSDFQYVVRTNGKSAFLFGMNYFRHNETEAVKDTRFKVKLNNETLTIPSNPITIPDSAIFMWPVNFDIAGINLKYATAQPLCKINNKWIFFANSDIIPEFCFNATNLKNITSTTGKVKKTNNNYIISNLIAGRNCAITLNSTKGTTQQIIILSAKEALNSWLLKTKNNKEFYLSNAAMYTDNNEITALSTNPDFSVFKLDLNNNDVASFSEKKFNIPEKEIHIEFKKTKTLEKSQWIKTSAVNKLDKTNCLLHRFFLKEFCLNNPSAIKQAQLKIYGESDFKIQVNNRWVNQTISPNQLNTIDLTGYVRKGDNKLMLDFPFADGEKAFAAELEIEYFNTNRVIYYSDQSWSSKDSYIFPTFLTGYSDFQAPEIAKRRQLKDNETIAKYEFHLPKNYITGLNNAYLQIDYSGDKGKMYINQKLIADNFYNGDIWEVGLNRLPKSLENKTFEVEITPLSNNARVYFDSDLAKNESKKAAVKSIQIIPEYKVSWNSKK